MDERETVNREEYARMLESLGALLTERAAQMRSGALWRRDMTRGDLVRYAAEEARLIALGTPVPPGT